MNDRYEHSSNIITCNYTFTELDTSLILAWKLRVYGQIEHHSGVVIKEGDKNYRLYYNINSKTNRKIPKVSCKYIFAKII